MSGFRIAARGGYDGGVKPRTTSILLWVFATLLTVALAAHQRMTGPTVVRRGTFTAGGAEHRYRLPRTWETGEEACVAVPDPGAAWAGRLLWRRFGTDEPFATLPLARRAGTLEARLPTQPPAGKVDYYLVLAGPGGEVRIPADPADDPTLRYKGRVPPYVLIPHVLAMFLALLFGVRAGLAGAFEAGRGVRLVVTVLALTTVGGFVLGPIMQELAFGKYWTGWPNGTDITDNKVLLGWLCWAVALVALRLLPVSRTGLRRTVLVVAAAVALLIYVIPHSARGTSLDYRAVEQGVSPEDALRNE